MEPGSSFPAICPTSPRTVNPLGFDTVLHTNSKEGAVALIPPTGWHSIVEYPGGTDQLAFEFNFEGGYIYATHIAVSIIDEATYAETSPSWTLTGEYTITLAAPVPSGSKLRIRRNTPKDTPLVNYKDGSMVSEPNLDLANAQAVMSAAEAEDEARLNNWRIDNELVGPQGDKGEPGTDGADGESAYEVAVSNGFTGTEAEWLASLVGPPGSPGSSTADTVSFAPTAAPLNVRTVADRLNEVVTPFDFGAVGDGVTNDLPALQAFSDWLFAGARPTVTADISGEFAIDASAGALLFGPTASNGEVEGSWSIRGHLRLISLGGGFELCRLRNLTEQHILGSFSAQGAGGDAFANRLNGVGYALENCGNMKVSGGFLVDCFWYSGISTPVVNNDGAQLGKITARWCGSGKTGYTLQSPYTGVSNNGAAGASQRTTFTGITNFPDAAIEGYSSVDNQPIFVRINGEVSFVKSWDRVAGTVDVYPAMDTALTGSGTLDWVFGCGFWTNTSDGNCIVVDKLKAQNCGIGLGISSLYGPRINQANISGCGIGSSLGTKPNGACIGTSIDAIYEEGNDIDRVYMFNTTTSSHYYINSAFEVDLAKIVVINGARDLANNRLTGQLGGTLSGPVCTFPMLGRVLKYHGPSANKTVGVNDTFRDQREEPKTRTIFRDSQTVTIEVQHEGYNRLFGFNGAIWQYIGTGTDGAPTGTFTFKPPAGGTINGGAVGASVNFSGFSGPALFSIYHTDAAQLTWHVRLISGGKSYVDGTCTLVLEDSAGNKATMGSTNSFRYTKQGSLVTVSGTLNWTATAALVAGSRLKITGLPYAANAQANYRAPAIIGSAPAGSFNISRGEIGFGVDGGNSFVWCTKIGTNNLDGPMTKADIGTAGSIYGLQVTYHI